MREFLALGVNGSVGMNAMGGAWSAPATNATAYPHRDFLFNMEINTIWYDAELDDRVRAWSRAAY